MRTVARIPKKIVLSVKASGVREEIESAMLIGEIATALALLFEISKGKDSFWFTYVLSFFYKNNFHSIINDYYLIVMFLTLTIGTWTHCLKWNLCHTFGQTKNVSL